MKVLIAQDRYNILKDHFLDKAKEGYVLGERKMSDGKNRK